MKLSRGRKPTSNTALSTSILVEACNTDSLHGTVPPNPTDGLLHPLLQTALSDVQPLTDNYEPSQGPGIHEMV
jgi:hypothetical protein